MELVRLFAFEGLLGSVRHAFLDYTTENIDGVEAHETRFDAAISLSSKRLLNLQIPLARCRWLALHVRLAGILKDEEVLVIHLVEQIGRAECDSEPVVGQVISETCIDDGVARLVPLCRAAARRPAALIAPVDPWGQLAAQWHAFNAILHACIGRPEGLRLAWIDGPAVNIWRAELMVADRTIKDETVDRFGRRFRFNTPDACGCVNVEAARDAGEARYATIDFLLGAGTAGC